MGPMQIKKKKTDWIQMEHQNLNSSPETKYMKLACTMTKTASKQKKV